jgi:autotransporter translocation and assembly factor TamB
MQLNAHRAIALLTAMLVVALASPVSAQVDMTGTWVFDVDVQGQVTNPSMTLQQNGTQITGTYSSPTLGDADVTGTVEGNRVTVTFEVDFGGQGGTVSYSGTVNSAGLWSGDFSLAGLADGTFVGEKS